MWEYPKAVFLLMKHLGTLEKKVQKNLPGTVRDTLQKLNKIRGISPFSYRVLLIKLGN